jgi:hypothetical protein
LYEKVIARGFIRRSDSVMNKSKEYTFHGFPGLHGDLSLLSQYVTFDLNKSDAKFVITVNHDVSH